jgi:hypothetical protein
MKSFFDLMRISKKMTKAVVDKVALYAVLNNHFFRSVSLKILRKGWLELSGDGVREIMTRLGQFLGRACKPKNKRLCSSVVEKKYCIFAPFC